MVSQCTAKGGGESPRFQTLCVSDYSCWATGRHMFTKIGGGSVEIGSSGSNWRIFARRIVDICAIITRGLIS